MIISFNPSVFQSRNSEIQSDLANILKALMNHKIHFLNIKSVYSIFYNESLNYIFDSSEISQIFFSQNDRKQFKEFLSKKSQVTLTSLLKQHLRTLTIGLDNQNGEIHPKNAYKIITERSKIIVENGINDWKFITGICQKYSGGRGDRRTIYKLINQAIKDEIIGSENCGGIGEIRKVTEKYINSEIYKNIYTYKLMAIFDSDKQSASDSTPNKSVIEYLKKKEIDTLQASDYKYETTDLIVWHILYKRKIENYISLEILFAEINSITPEHKHELLKKTNEELDFIEYNSSNIGMNNSVIKSKFPQLLLDKCYYRDFEQRCEHHKVFVAEVGKSISEIEQILLKIAKIL